MQLTRCPVCHSRINLEALVQDEAGRGLLALMAKLNADLATALVSYIGLFRAKSRDLASDRALRLCNEVLALGESKMLTSALCQTLESMRAKQFAGQFKVLSNHNYLKRVLEDSGTTLPVIGPTEQTHAALPNKQQKRAAISNAIMDIHDTNW